MRPLCQRLQRPLYQRLQRRGFNGDGRSTERPYNRYTSRCSGTDARPSVPTTVTRLAVRGRTLDRASLQPLHVSLFGDGRLTERPYNRYTSRCSGTDARPSVPTAVTRLAVRGQTLDRASLQPLLVSLFGDGRSTVRPYDRYTSGGGRHSSWVL